MVPAMKVDHIAKLFPILECGSRVHLPSGVLGYFETRLALETCVSRPPQKPKNLVSGKTWACMVHCDVNRHKVRPSKLFQPCKLCGPVVETAAVTALTKKLRFVISNF